MTERVEKLRQNDHRIQDTVYGFVRECKKTLLTDNLYSELVFKESHDSLPNTINHVIIKYYYSKQLSYNHLLLASEIFYLKELQCIKDYIFVPIRDNISTMTDGNNDTLTMTQNDINIAFKHWDHLLTFHDSFLSAIREQKHILPTLHQYINFTKIYVEYAKEYEKILNIFSNWTCSNFKQFIIKQLENENLIKIIENNLCSLPWYLYRPFDRIKEYRRFVKDLQLLSQSHDEDYELINKTKTHLSHTYKQIKKDEQLFQQKTRMVEIQLSIDNVPFRICDTERVLSSAKNYDVKYGANDSKSAKMKIYIFNNLLICASLSDDNGISSYIGSFSFYHFGLGLAPSHLKIKDGTETVSAFDIYLQDKPDSHLKILFKDDQRRDKILKKIQKKYKECQEKLWAETSLNSTTKSKQETNIAKFDPNYYQ